jgi:hypothetical protein
MAIQIQEHVGNKITVLCGVSEEALTKVGVLDTKGAPWYDWIILGAPERPIAMPATLVIDKKMGESYLHLAPLESMIIHE